MEFDIGTLTRAARYKILSSCVAPRPIAWVTSLSREGVRNAAPYSFFNMFGHEPLTIALGLLAHGQGHFKDTATNILETVDFVVNLVHEYPGKVLNITCREPPS